jgi:carbamoyl-phosphate synthase small subunit
MNARLALEDGSVFTGKAFGGTGTRTGEVIFNTGLTGYQEVLSDPSYCGQIVTMTFPQIGNVGVNPEDFESEQPHLSGFVVKDLPRRPSNYRSTAALDDYLAQAGVIGIADVDTRALTRRIRVHGALRGALSTEIDDEARLVELARDAEPMLGAGLVQRVTRSSPGSWTDTLWQSGPSRGVDRAPACRVVVIDCGAKHNILRHLIAAGCEVSVVPSGFDAQRIRAMEPDGMIVSNGPGDPAAVADTAAMLKSLIGTLPILGICLGHQLLAIALGAETYKLRFGHHGVNVPVLHRPSGRVQITSQNHGFAVSVESLERVGGVVTHTNLNDGSLEGFTQPDLRISAVQFHPEASPGPHDASGLFNEFVASVRHPASARAERADPQMV